MGASTGTRYIWKEPVSLIIVRRKVVPRDKVAEAVQEVLIMRWSLDRSKLNKIESRWMF